MIDSEAVIVIAIQLVLTLVLIVTFFVMAANISKIRQLLQVSLFPSGMPEVVRVCPHCKGRIDPEAATCSHCQRDLEPWVKHEGRWWKRDDAGQDQYLDTGTWQWVKSPTSMGGGETASPR